MGKPRQRIYLNSIDASGENSMFAKNSLPYAFVFAMALTAMPGTLPAQEDAGKGEPWALSLSAQLAAEKRCNVQVTYFVREMPVDGGTAYSGRVRCIDGREFDFSQAKPHLKFDLKACEPTAC